MIDHDIKELLESEAARINSPAFIDKDPVQFPRRFSDLRDIEIVALLSAIIAWGNRKMICRDAERMLTLMEHQPYAYMMDQGYEDLDPKVNIHRTMFGADLQWFLRGLHPIYEKYGSLDAYASAIHIADDRAPAWKLVKHLNSEMALSNQGETCSRCLPTNIDTTALKRVNMALRWLVRDDGIVDMGVWRSIHKSQLFVPLDVHVGNTARNLGLLTRKSNDRKSVEQLTATLRELRPDDPVWFDYALFGIGVEGKGN